MPHKSVTANRRCIKPHVRDNALIRRESSIWHQVCVMPAECSFARSGGLACWPAQRARDEHGWRRVVWGGSSGRLAGATSGCCSPGGHGFSSELAAVGHHMQLGEVMHPIETGAVRSRQSSGLICAWAGLAVCPRGASSPVPVGICKQRCHLLRRCSSPHARSCTRTGAGA